MSKKNRSGQALERQDASLAEKLMDQAIELSIEEDLGPYSDRHKDVTTEATVSPGCIARARVELRQKAIIAGMPVFEKVMKHFDRELSIKRLYQEGEYIEGVPTDIITIEGNAAAILTSERLALNLMQRISAVATLTYEFSKRAKPIEILHTRKTTPCLRAFERYAVLQGGGALHRSGLYDRILIKENHIVMAGSIKAAIARSKERFPEIEIEIEARTMTEVKEAAGQKVDIILLDNMSSEMVKEAVRLIAGRARIEVSGGITLDCLDSYLIEGVDFISIGALTHSAKSIDMSLILL